MSYDSAQDTTNHIAEVGMYIGRIILELQKRARGHDASKLNSPEKEVFDRVTPKLKTLTYGSPEYKASLEDMGPALTHHYENNDHHPEHRPEGVAGMDLLSIIEMLCDWKAATKRMKDGDIRKSLRIQKDRFQISDQLCAVLLNTVNRLGW